MTESNFEKLGILNSAGQSIRRKAAPTSTLGASGGSAYGGYVTSNEKNPNLIGSRRYKTYSEILANTTIVAAAVRYFLNVLGRSSWRVEPAETEGSNEESTAEHYAELIEAELDAMATPWIKIIRRAAMYRFHGFGIQEWTAKRKEEGHFGMLDIYPRPQSTIERWDIDDQGTVLGMWQSNPQTMEEVYLPRGKVIYLVDDALNDSPEGLGLFRSVVANAKRLERYEQLEGFGFETDLRGIPVGRVPYQEIRDAVKNTQMSEAQGAAAVANVENFVRSHIKNPELGIVLDSTVHQSQGDTVSPSSTYKWGIDLLSGDGGNFEAVHTSIERINHEIARVLHCEHLLLGQSRGTQALSHDKSDNFAMVVDSTLGEIAETFNADMVERLFDINGWDKNFMPCLKPGRIQFRDIQKITGALNDMASAGAILAPDDPVINEVRDELGLSHAPEYNLDLLIPTVVDPDKPTEPGKEKDDKKKEVEPKNQPKDQIEE